MARAEKKIPNVPALPEPYFYRVSADRDSDVFSDVRWVTVEIVAPGKFRSTVIVSACTVLNDEMDTTTIETILVDLTRKAREEFTAKNNAASLYGDLALYIGDHVA